MPHQQQNFKSWHLVAKSYSSTSHTVIQRINNLKFLCSR